MIKPRYKYGIAGIVISLCLITAIVSQVAYHSEISKYKDFEESVCIINNQTVIKTLCNKRCDCSITCSNQTDSGMMFCDKICPQCPYHCYLGQYTVQFQINSSMIFENTIDGGYEDKIEDALSTVQEYSINDHVDCFFHWNSFQPQFDLHSERPYLNTMICCYAFSFIIFWGLLLFDFVRWHRTRQAGQSFIAFLRNPKVYFVQP